MSEDRRVTKADAAKVRSEPQTQHTEPVDEDLPGRKGSQLRELGEGSPVLKPGETGRVVDDYGHELSVIERLVLLEGGKPGYGRVV